MELKVLDMKRLMSNALQVSVSEWKSTEQVCFELQYASNGLELNIRL